MNEESSEQVKYLIHDKVHKLSEYAQLYSSQIQCKSSDLYFKTDSKWKVLSRNVMTRLHEQSESIKGTDTFILDKTMKC